MERSRRRDCTGQVAPANARKPSLEKCCRRGADARHSIGCANSAQNYNNANGIYDGDDNRIGYAVPRADGSGINYFDNSGRRTGYQNYENR
jgi:hypothetical protein